MSQDWFRKTAMEIRDAVRAGAATATDVTESHLQRISDIDTKVDAYTQVWRDTAMAQATAVDAKIKRGEDPGPMAGVPVALKEVLCTREGFTTAPRRFSKVFAVPMTPPPSVN